MDSATSSALLTAIQNNGRILGTIQQAIIKMFPQLLGTATTAVAGSATLPAAPVGFLTVTNPVTGTTVKIPYYS
jgi:hypothetical protein